MCMCQGFSAAAIVFQQNALDFISVREKGDDSDDDAEGGIKMYLHSETFTGMQSAATNAKMLLHLAKEMQQMHVVSAVQGVMK